MKIEPKAERVSQRLVDLQTETEEVSEVIGQEQGSLPLEQCELL